MRSMVYRMLTVAMAGGLVMAAQLLVAARAHADCPEGQQQDPNTRMCWSQSSQGGGYYSGGGPCQPGQVGDCVGQLRPNPLQNPGPQTEAGPPDPATAGENAWLPSNRR
jgi:hypothetical protein